LALRWAAGVPGLAWALCALLPLLQLTISATFPVVPQVREAFALSYSELGIYLASLSFARLLADLPAGQLATRYNGRRLLAISGVTTFVVCTLAALASEYWQLLLARVIIGGVTAINQAVVLAWLVSLASARNRGVIMGLSEAAFSLMVVFSPLIAGALAELLSWRTPFVMGAVASAAALALVQWGTRDEQAVIHQRANTAEPAPSFARLLPTGGTLLVLSFLLCVAIFFGRQALTAVYLPVLGRDVLELSPFLLGVAISGIALWSTFVTMAGSALADRLGRTASVLPGMGLLVLVPVPLAFIHDVPSYFALAWLQALAAAVNALPLSLVGDALPPGYRGLGMAGYRLVADVAILAGPLAAGVALDYFGVRGAWAVIWGGTALCAALALLVARRKPAPEARQ
jgi:DHA1 family multidrug resistance protein-like MFS transporter